METWLAQVREAEPDGDPIPRFVERDLRKYLECGILAHGFGRARCGGCGHDFLIAYSCKGRGVCPSYNTRRMAETAAHLVDHVFPQVPVRQWVLSLPKRLRYFLHREPALIGPVLRIFLDAVEDRLKVSSPGALAEARFGAVTFVHRFGSALNANLHFHCAVPNAPLRAAVTAHAGLPMAGSAQGSSRPAPTGELVGAVPLQIILPAKVT